MVEVFKDPIRAMHIKNSKGGSDSRKITVCAVVLMIFWKHPKRKVVLASASPRRKQILTQMGLNFEVIVPNEFNESDTLDIQNLGQSLQNLAIQKAQMVADIYRDALVLGADTIVLNDSMILGKPADYQDAFEMLRSLSGKSHKVMTGVALLCSESHFIKSSVGTTEVVFRSICDQEIHEYLSSGEYCDKAGAYAIQGKAMVFVESIRGCYYNVVGLPVVNTIGLFREFVVRKESADV